MNPYHKINDDGEEIDTIDDEPEIKRRNYGSLIPITRFDPDWKGFTVPEWLRINTTDGAKRYK